MALRKLNLTGEIVPEDDMFVARCLEVPICSQGNTVEEAANNLREAVILWLATASREETLEYFPQLAQPEKPHRVFSTRFEVPIEQTASHVGR